MLFSFEKMLDGSSLMRRSSCWRRRVWDGEELSKRCVILAGSNVAFKRSAASVGFIRCFGLGMLSFDAIVIYYLY